MAGDYHPYGPFPIALVKDRVRNKESEDSLFSQLEAWLGKYNKQRPRESIGGVTPMIYAQQRDSSRNKVSIK